MVGGIEQPALLELALDLDEAVAELAQQPDARRLVIDKGAAAAVRTEQPAQYDCLALAVEPGLAQNRMRRVVAADREFGRYDGLMRSGPHQPGLRPLAEREAQRIEQDRLAGPGLAGQYAKSRTQGEIETIDQNNVADGQAEQHCEPQVVALINDIGGTAAKLALAPHKKAVR